MSRRAGILLHPSSLPSHSVCGDLGQGIVYFLDWMVQSGLSIWQTLPLHPPGGGFSPYSSPSIFAGAVYLISLEKLVEKDILSPQEIANPPQSRRIQEPFVREWKLPRVYLAARRLATKYPELIAQFSKDNHWAENWALYSALCTKHNTHNWQEFPADLRKRKAEAMAQAKAELEEEIRTEIAAQYIFFEQWFAVKSEANKRNIILLGDMPIFVAAGGADVWENQHLFRLDKQGYPDPVSGAPPDAFSPIGQHWGNPLYNWKNHKKNQFDWWVKRLDMELQLSDWVRIDHFRGFCAAWEIPKAADGDARMGSWGESLGTELFAELRKHFLQNGELPFVAEDLGVITADVDALREQNKLMGMKILQFAFDSFEHPYLPHNYDGKQWVCYTGTHDNDTVIGWYKNTTDLCRHRYRTYVARDGSEPHWDFIRLAWSSTARWTITTMQDVIGLDSQGRMNLPGQGAGQWGWRMQNIPWNTCTRLYHTAETYARLPKSL